MAIFGHTHIPEVAQVGPMLFCNAGFWSPAFADPTCKTRLGSQTFARVRPGAAGRQLELWEWPVGGDTAKPWQEPQ